MRSLHHIEVDRGAGEASFRRRWTTCGSGEAVGIFPEATISRSMELKEFKTGAVRIAAEAGVPLVPVIMWGTQRMMTKDHPQDFSRGKTIAITRRRAAAPDRRGPGRRDRRAARRDDRRCSTGPSATTPPTSSRPGSWWLPASYGGSAPTPEEALRLDAEEKRLRARASKANKSTK